MATQASHTPPEIESERSEHQSPKPLPLISDQINAVVEPMETEKAVDCSAIKTHIDSEAISLANTTANAHHANNHTIFKLPSKNYKPASNNEKIIDTKASFLSLIFRSKYVDIHNRWRPHQIAFSINTKNKRRQFFVPPEDRMYSNKQLNQTYEVTLVTNSLYFNFGIFNFTKENRITKYQLQSAVSVSKLYDPGGRLNAISMMKQHIIVNVYISNSFKSNQYQKEEDRRKSQLYQPITMLCELP